MKIQALGGCCKKSTANYENAVEAAKICGITEVVEQVSDMNEIMKHGVLSTPGLVINGKVVSSGRVLKTEQIVEFIKNNL
ncbi:thioredoxin family protein [Acholeplasma granularum]|uniref:thioredoxin family protein n=1 Tax=Acholeplasma granularum TaxID=264635 RepID=UPI00046EFBB7|nr:thioredoxin family protein [Acholeplasma granularum]